MRLNQNRNLRTLLRTNQELNQRRLSRSFLASRRRRLLISSTEQLRNKKVRCRKRFNGSLFVKESGWKLESANFSKTMSLLL
ncbi:hypothetical protein D3C85_1782880 [compost metagenome]